MSNSNPWADINVVRKTFIDFFVEKCGHEFIPSSSVVPHEDPTLLFINAGMNQFKTIFTGQVDPKSRFGQLKRAANSQKCIRAGGKHNDLEDVGKDTYHHTFFEMLGNWSFGDYFKEEAITWAWQLLTEVYKLDPNRLYVTYFGGDPKLPDCPPDYEARDIWKRFVPENRIIACGMKENFWEMAETGPCGPCSEIHYDRIGGRDAAHLVNADDPMVVEIWNNVFMQYNRERDGSLTKLPFGSVDTGMGLERLASILIDRPSNYDISSFQYIFGAIQKSTEYHTPYTGKVGEEDVTGADMAYRVIADHIRTLSVAIADGALPSNDGRGYVLRRILRRAIRYGRQKLNAPTRRCWFTELVPAVVHTLGDVYPTLKSRQAVIESVIASEEKQFAATLERGLREFERIKPEGKVFPGGDPGAFSLLTTYGFPLDLTQLMAAEAGLTVDLAAFDAAFEEHRQKAREGGKKAAGEALQLLNEHLDQLSKSGAPATNDSFKYEWTPAEGTGAKLTARVVGVLSGRSLVDSATGRVGLVLDRTTFYAESGGQVADNGIVVVGGRDSVVEDVQRFGSYVLHTVSLPAGVAVATGDEVELLVDYETRAATARNHTGTHVLNFALRKVLGDEVEQRGSLVDPQRLRFDYSLMNATPLEALVEVQRLVCETIAAARTVSAEVVPLEAARRIPGLRMLAGEQYPDPVRVVSLASPVQTMIVDGFSGASGLDASVEFCGGTHLHNTREMIDFVIISEEGVAKGIRRIIGFTGDAAKRARSEAQALEAEVAALEGRNDSELDSAVSSLRGTLDTHSGIPLDAKRSLLARVDAIKARLLEEAKAKTKKLLDAAAEQAKAAAAACGECCTKKICVYEVIDCNGDAKVVDNFAKTFEAALPGRAFVAYSGKVGTPLSLIVVGNKEVDAAAVLKTICSTTLVKGGGKPAKAIGAVREIPDAAALKAIVDAVNAL